MKTTTTSRPTLARIWCLFQAALMLCSAAIGAPPHQVWTVVGDGKADDTDALEQAIADGGPITIPSETTCRFTRPLTIPAGRTFVVDGALLFDSKEQIPAITIGSPDKLNSRARLRIDVRRRTPSDWSDASSIGVVLHNPVECEIDLARVEGFTIGCQFAAHLAAAYNSGVRLGRLVDNAIGLDLRSFSPNGYPNENSFVGGRFSYTSGTNRGSARYGVRFSAEPGAYRTHNGNSFYSPTFELGAEEAAPGEAIPVLIETDATHNLFASYRTERNTEPHVTVLGPEAGLNEFRPLFNQAGSPLDPSRLIRWQGKRRSDLMRTPEIELMTPRSEWNSGDLLAANPLVSWENAAGAKATPKRVGGYVQDAAPCIYIDATRCKRFVARKLVDPTRPGRFAVRCYTEDPRRGKVIGGDQRPLVHGMKAGEDPFWWPDTYGGSYGRGQDSNSDWFFSVDDSVRFLALIVHDAKTSTFSIGAVDPGPIRVFAVRPQRQ